MRHYLSFNYSSVWVDRWLPAWSLILILALSLIVARIPLSVAGIIIFGLILILVTYIYPLAGLGIALVAGPLGAFENVILGPLPIESGQLIFLLVVAIWLARSMVRHRISIQSSPVNLPLFVFILISSLTLLDTVSLASGIKELVKWVELGVAMLMVIDLSRQGRPDVDRRRRYGRANHLINGARPVLAILLIAGFSQAAIGIWQFGLRGDGPEHFMILDRFYRAFGTFMQPNPFGGFMGVSASLGIGTTIGLIIHFILNIRDGWLPGTRQWLWFAFVALCALATSLALLMSWSRGAWLGFAAGMTVLVIFLPRRRWIGIALLLVLIVVLVLALDLGIVPQTVAARFGDLGSDLQLSDVRREFVTIDNYALVERVAHWQAGLDMARHNLWEGVGFGNYDRTYVDYALLNWPIALGHAHNYYINLLAEVGVFGTAAYIILWLVIIVQNVRILRRLDWPHRGIALGLLAAWTAISVHHLVDKLYVNNMFIFFGVMLGLQQILDGSHD